MSREQTQPQPPCPSPLAGHSWWGSRPLGPASLPEGWERVKEGEKQGRLRGTNGLSPENYDKNALAVKCGQECQSPGPGLSHTSVLDPRVAWLSFPPVSAAGTEVACTSSSPRVSRVSLCTQEQTGASSSQEGRLSPQQAPALRMPPSPTHIPGPRHRGHSGCPPERRALVELDKCGVECATYVSEPQ